MEATLHPLGNCGMNRNVRGFSDACNRGVVCCGVGGRCRIAGSILMAGDHHIQDRTTIPGPTPTTAFEPTAATRTPGRPATARATAAAAAGLGITSAKTATNQRSMVAALVCDPRGGAGPPGGRGPRGAGPPGRRPQRWQRRQQHGQPVDSSTDDHSNGQGPKPGRHERLTRAKAILAARGLRGTI